MTPCGCGCGQPVKSGNRFVRFHHLRVHNRDPKFRAHLSNLKRKLFKNPTTHPCYGKRLSEETKGKISLAHVGMKRSRESRRRQGESISKLWSEHPEKNPAYGKPSWNKGLTKNSNERVASIARSVKKAHRSGKMEIAYRKVSSALKGKLTGKENPNWKGGYEPYYGPNWREQRRKALEHDKHICQRCGAPEDGREHDVHHIIPFRVLGLEGYKEANKLDNLITLCPSCHKLMKEVEQLEWSQGLVAANAGATISA